MVLREEVKSHPFNEVRPCGPSEVFPDLIENTKLLLLDTDSHQINDQLLLKRSQFFF